MKYCLSILIVLQCFCANAQNKYFIEFTNKDGTPFSIDNPHEFLSARSIERRVKQNIAITYDDLPVNPAFIETLNTNGAKILYTINWLNGAVVEIDNQSILSTVASLPFVSQTIEIYNSTASKSSLPDFDILLSAPKKQKGESYYQYGASAHQIEMLNGNILHNNGYRGQGMLVAVLDAGFSNANSISSLSHLWTNERVVLTRDIVNPQSNIYEEHSHGTTVLTVMASYLPGELIGTAPEASYALIRCEDANSEQLIEEYNWVYAAQIADSIGADVINSSLGYYEFDDDTQNHTYANMDGATTPIAIGANHAASKGMLIVNSVGNEGQSSWEKLITPSDSPNVLAVGAVDSNGDVAFFSSLGPSADGRIKPDVVALGYGTAVQSATGQIGTANGTSLSAPIISGLAACLWQAKPNEGARDIYDLILLSSSNYTTPNFELGYGLPNFASAINSIDKLFDENKLSIFPNPNNGRFSVWLPQNKISTYSILVTSSHGAEVMRETFETNSNIYSFSIPSTESSGLYIVNLMVGSKNYLGKIIKIDSLP